MFLGLRCSWIVVNHLSKQTCVCAPAFKNSHSLSYQIFNYNASVTIKSSNFIHTSVSNESENKNKNNDVLMLEKWIEMCRLKGERVPKIITDKQFQTLMKLEGTFKKKKYLSFLFKKELLEKGDKLRKEKAKEKKSLLQKERELRNTGHITYGLWKNSMFAKIDSKCILNFYHHRLVSAMIHGQPLVVDMDFDDHMEGREISSISEQMLISISQNRKNRNPFNLMFCNVNLKSQVLQNFENRMSLLNSEYPGTFTSKSYLDLFPKEKLVYLTPDSNYEMTKFDHDAVYIIGGIVDLRNQKPLTLAKAKQENIKMYKLPLDRYMKLSDKTLALHIIVSILLDLKNTGDWNQALKNIPRRLVMRGRPYSKS